MGKSATLVKDCSRAPMQTVIMSSRRLGRCLAVDEFKRGQMTVLRRGGMSEVLTSELTCQQMWNIYRIPKAH